MQLVTCSSGSYPSYVSFLVSVRCYALCFWWLILFLPFLPLSLSYQFLDYATEAQYYSIVFTQKWPYPFLDRGNRSHELNDTVWLKPWVYTWASFLPSGLVSYCLLGSCISLRLCCSICYTVLSYSSCHPVIMSLSTYLLTFVLNTSGVLGEGLILVTRISLSLLVIIPNL